MNPLKRPVKPKTWDGKVQTARDAIETKLKKNQLLVKDDLKQLCSDEERRQFESAQHGLCGYCSSKLVNAVGQIDHYRPKADVHRAIKTQGSERVSSVRVEGRSLLPKGGITPAWPRLAYDWNNYVYACERCNVAWKRTLFPAVDPQTQALVMGPPRSDESPLLLSPFELTDPAKHFVFEETGAVRGQTLEGAMTVRVCGLGRPSLLERRHDHFEFRLRLLDDLARSDMPVLERRCCVRKVVKLGQWEREYAAIWRDLVRQRRFCWAALEDEARSADEPGRAV